MKILHRKTTYSDYDVTVNVVMFECDCGKVYNIAEQIRTIDTRNVLDYKYCPYCGKEIKMEEVKERE